MNAYHGEVDVRKQECVAYDALRTSHQQKYFRGQTTMIPLTV